MKIEVRHASHPEAVRGYDTQTLRRHFLVETVFVGGESRLYSSHYDHMVIGGATPLDRGQTCRHSRRSLRKVRGYRRGCRISRGTRF
jgi:5-keto 4-deoxyuronate isomerase